MGFLLPFSVSSIFPQLLVLPLFLVFSRLFALLLTMLLLQRLLQMLRILFLFPLLLLLLLVRLLSSGSAFLLLFLLGLLLRLGSANAVEAYRSATGAQLRRTASARSSQPRAGGFKSGLKAEKVALQQLRVHRRTPWRSSSNSEQSLTQNSHFSKEPLAQATHAQGLHQQHKQLQQVHHQQQH